MVIADDSEVPLDIVEDSVELIHLPFNSGVSIGLNKALERVEPPFLVKLSIEY